MRNLELLQLKFPDALIVKPTQAGSLLNQSRQSTYNQVSSGRFPVPMVVDHLKRKMVRLTDLANYLDSLQVVPSLQTSPAESNTPKLKKGRPTKATQVAARNLGLTVPEFYARAAQKAGV